MQTRSTPTIEMLTSCLMIFYFDKNWNIIVISKTLTIIKAREEKMIRGYFNFEI